MSSPLFDQTIIDQYANVLNLESTGVYLYGLETLRKTHRMTRLKYAITKSCDHQIGSQYINDAYEQLRLGNPLFDAVVCTNKPLTQILSAHLDQHTLGIIIVEKGECRTYPDIYSINLICAQYKKGTILIGAYLYAIAQNPRVIHKAGILELAHGYLNAPGLCLYSKFGFQNKPELTSAECFADPSNLPMISELSQFGQTSDQQCTHIIDIVTGNSKGFSKPFLCAYTDKQIQQVVGAFMNLRFLIDHHADEQVIEKNNSWFDGMKINYAFISQNVDVHSVLSKLERNKYIHKPLLKEYFSQIFENGESVPNADTKLKSKKAAVEKSKASTQHTKKNTVKPPQQSKRKTRSHTRNTSIRP